MLIMSTKNTKKKTGKNAKKKMKVSHNSPEKKDEASQKTGNILSQILSADDVSSQDTGNVDDNASALTSYTETCTGPDYDNILTSTPHTEGPFVLVIPDEILKSSISNNPTKSIKSGKLKKNWGRSLTPIIAPTPIRASTLITPMQIDDEYCNFEERDEHSQTMQRLVVVDELSDEFWNRAYKKVSKELIPKILFLSDTEYREALERYLTEHLLPEIKNKCRSKRNDLAANIRNTMFSNFGEQKLEHVDSSAFSKKIAKWKKSSELPPEYWVYVLAICDIVLNPSSPGIKCNDKL
ncbi:15773_t:CDS:2, partial [Rhizophagus irregularis]